MLPSSAEVIRWHGPLLCRRQGRLIKDATAAKLCLVSAAIVTLLSMPRPRRRNPASCSNVVGVGKYLHAKIETRVVKLAMLHSEWFVRFSIVFTFYCGFLFCSDHDTIALIARSFCAVKQTQTWTYPANVGTMVL